MPNCNDYCKTTKMSCFWGLIPVKRLCFKHLWTGYIILLLGKHGCQSNHYTVAVRIKLINQMYFVHYRFSFNYSVRSFLFCLSTIFLSIFTITIISLFFQNYWKSQHRLTGSNFKANISPCWWMWGEKLNLLENLDKTSRVLINYLLGFVK